jgi:hypothetical protein
MPTRRQFELTVIIVALSRPVFGMARLWAAKTFGSSQPGSIAHGVAEIVSVIA